MAIKQVTPPDAQALIGRGYRYLDVRTEAEFAAGHPASAVNIPIFVRDAATGQMAPNADFLATVETTFPKDSQIVLGCMSGMRSQRAAELMAGAGYGDLCNMQGGFGGARDQFGRVVTPGWVETGLPICTDCAPENTYAGLRSRR
ncbi:MAG TPA: rhodanese-like domain-containing protein [Candidatus Binatia bacterium]|nr:rhodanese-like domain-containing protein [Candidatus Binatia bacterium]